MSKRALERKRIAELEARLQVRGGRQLLPGRDDTGLLTALEITIGMIPDPADKYRWALGPDGQALVARLFQATTAATVDRIIPTDTPEVAQAKYRDWIG
ncbi:MAG: hypothetical protein EOS54_09530 [Mesorhizobium sp.]|uniref:hypothetical protein n=1 Tax=unclassified Mesorhizobium TaxID=325217 RepID=UPI000F74DC84|nr:MULTISPECIES: hypothetical protein [unclassified Mesorhizobium]AZO46910.1 hypothetical protein EJ073_03090 [Mesorhizobium sp. M4B.F.Ca.ET.058.02.1.1]RWC54903.1 MAG: hypothetical protein EOS54_09530 [Mesorhizobium sp.]TIU72006.1 MAG: hypothetical protein E5W25_02195 [Mesorhizobium sp.]TIV82138.1 MAG: hypothetical protein E5V64_13255 [Mesorhizobium sp.]TIW11110.1 MAG: hypothetical protein E5V66_15020 [Mesorhizobium sp.]